MTFDSLIKYFIEDPFRLLTLVLTFVGGSGGVVYWYDRIKNRTRIKIRSLNVNVSTEPPLTMSFEAENLGASPTSLEPYITLKGYIYPGAYHQRKMTRFNTGVVYTLTIEDSCNRTLQPRVPKQFIARCDSTDKYSVFCVLCIYTLYVTTGALKRVRTRMIDGKTLGFWRLLFEKYKYLVFNRLTLDK